MNLKGSPLKPRTSLFPLFLTVFLDLLGLGIVIPIFAPLFLDPVGGLFSFQTGLSTRTMLLGFLLAIYPLTQFFGAPFLGALSDRFGRKQILQLSLLGTLFGYLLLAAGILLKSLPLLFIARAVDGFTGGNISIAQSAISDLSDEKSRTRNFGFIGMAFGLGFIIGPFIGGKLADPSILSWFNYATPFWFAAILTGINLVLVQLRFQETLRSRRETPLDFLSGFRNIGRALSMPNARTMFLVVFLLAFGFNFFTQFFQVFLIQKFQFTQSQIGDLFAYIGLWIAITQGLINRPLSRRLEAPQILSFSALLLAVALPLLLLPSQSSFLFFLLPLVAIFQGLTQPSSLSIVSGLCDAKAQGQILGINQSFQSLAQAIPPIIAGFIVSLDQNLPILVAGVSVLAAWVLFLVYRAGVRRRGPEKVCD